MSARAINAPPAERIAYSRYARPKHRDKPLTRLKIVPVPEVQTFGGFGQYLRILAWVMLMCPLIAAGVWGARQADFLMTRTQSGLAYCADDPIVEFDRCDSLPEGQIACKQRALERLRDYTAICFPESVAAFK